MRYNNNLPEFMAPVAVKTVNRRFDITETQNEKLLEIERELKIPPSAIVRLALNVFLPKIKDENFKYEGIKKLWNETKF